MSHEQQAYKPTPHKPQASTVGLGLDEHKPSTLTADEHQASIPSTEERQAWKELIGQFYDFESQTLTNCENAEDNSVGIQLSICARLFQTGHTEEAEKLWDKLVQESDPDSLSADMAPSNNPNSQLMQDVKRARIASDTKSRPSSE